MQPYLKSIFSQMLTNLINKLSTQYDPNFGKKWKEVCVLIEKKIY